MKKVTSDGCHTPKIFRPYSSFLNYQNNSLNGVNEKNIHDKHDIEIISYNYVPTCAFLNYFLVQNFCYKCGIENPFVHYELAYVVLNLLFVENFCHNLHTYKAFLLNELFYEHLSSIYS